jgi:F0F1-type ATP synthase assembly protein I
MKDEQYRSVRQIGLLTTIPFILVLAPLIGFTLGKYLDGWLNTAPVLRYVFAVLGMVAAVRETITIVKKAGEDPGPPGE